MLHRGLVWLMGVVLLVACGEATFEAPSIPVNPSTALPVAPIVSVPVAPAKRTTQKFRQNRPHGTLNIAFIVRVNPESDNLNSIFLPRLRYLAQNLGLNELRWPGVPALSSYDEIRTTMLLEKKSELIDTATSWTIHKGNRNETELRRQFQQHVARLEMNLKQKSDEAFLSSPFQSIATVARSFSPSANDAPSYLHVVYVTDRDIFLDPSELTKTREELQRQLALNNAQLNGTTISVLNYENENSECKPHRNDLLDANVKTEFRALKSTFHELCDIPRDSMTQLLNTWIAEQQKLSLWYAPKPGSLIEVKINGTRISSANFRIRGRLIEWLGTNPPDGSAIEVTYEAQ